MKSNSLTFRYSELKSLLAYAKQQWPKEIRTGLGLPSKRGFWLVGDEGVYLMHNGQRDAKVDQQPLVYAEECNPTTMEFDDWWATKGATFGGDDGVEFIAAKTVEAAVAAKSDLTIRFMGSKFEVSHLEPKPKAVKP